MVTGVIFGCLPAFRSTRLALMSSIRQPIAGGRQPGWPVDKALVALQAALSLMLIIGAGLFLRTIDNLRTTPLGFDKKIARRLKHGRRSVRAASRSPETRTA